MSPTVPSDIATTAAPVDAAPVTTPLVKPAAVSAATRLREDLIHPDPLLDCPCPRST